MMESCHSVRLHCSWIMQGEADVLNAVLLWSSLTGLLLLSNRTNAGHKLVSSLTKEKGFRECLGKLEVFKLAEPVEHYS